MLPKHHIAYGAAFSTVSWLAFPQIGYQAITIFLASFLVDVDHYLIYVIREKNLNPKKAFKYFRKMHEVIKIEFKSLNIKFTVGKMKKSPLFILHSIEFLLLLFIISFYYSVFLFIFIGLAFHNILDIIDIQREFGSLAPRDYSIIQYIINKKQGKSKYL